MTRQIEELMSDIALLSLALEDVQNKFAEMSRDMDSLIDINNLFFESLLRIAKGGRHPKRDAYQTLQGAKMLCLPD